MNQLSSADMVERHAGTKAERNQFTMTIENYCLTLLIKIICEQHSGDIIFTPVTA